MYCLVLPQGGFCFFSYMENGLSEVNVVTESSVGVRLTVQLTIVQEFGRGVPHQPSLSVCLNLNESDTSPNRCTQRLVVLHTQTYR